MNKSTPAITPLVIVFLSVAAFLGVVWFGIRGYEATNRATNTNQVVCTMDAKLCPDGTAVGRVPPDCEFAPCPDIASNTNAADENTNAATTNTEPSEPASEDSSADDADTSTADNEYTNNDYYVTYPLGWYPHDQVDYVIFTKSEELVIPEATEGYAIGPQFITRAMAMVDAENQPMTKQAWVDQNIGTEDIDGNPIDTSEVIINGYAMTRVVMPAAGSSGDTLTYYHFADDRVYSLYHYPFVDGSSDANDFAELVATFTIN